MKLLKKKVAIVTGGTGDIGKSIIKTFVNHGAYVIFTFLSSKKNAKNIEMEFKESVKGYQVNLSEPNLSKKFVDNILKKYDNIDILVNNAGIIKDSIFIRMSYNNWNDVIKTNLYSVFHLTKLVIYHMIRNKRGNIINMSSVVGLTGNLGQSNYSASKAAIIGFTKSLARELGSRNIRCNAIAPGYISTKMNSYLISKIKNKWIQNIPLGRSGLPQEVANCVLFLASDLSSYITGTTLNVNGGII